MKTIVVITLIILSASFVYAQEDLAERYDENTELTIIGQIVEILQGSRGPVILKVRSDKDGRLYNVVTAPQWFLAHNKVKLSLGDRIEIIGSKFISKRGEIFIVTRQCRLSNAPPCFFRDSDMRPKWRGGMMRGHH